MPLSSIQASILAAITAVIGLVVSIAPNWSTQAQQLGSVASVVIPAIFLIANAIIHHGVTSATSKDASAK